MAHKNHTTDLTELLLKCVAQPDPMLSMLEWLCSQLIEAEDSYKALFENLKERGMATLKLVISDARAGLTAAIRKSFPGASWQRCKVHFMRNILAHIPLSGTLFANIP